MKRLDLEKEESSFKIGDKCPSIKPNIDEDCVFYVNGKPIGFYMRQMPEKMCKIADVANKEFRSDDVPKSVMRRGTEKQAKAKGLELVTQYSTILGSIAPKPHMRRPYPSMSSVHSVDSAKIFVKAMLMLARESEFLLQEIIPEQYKEQVKLFESVGDKWKFSNLFTSSISNYNISAPYHLDTGNIVGAVNVIITKRSQAIGGNLHVPDYGAVIDQCDNSILVYPAWQNVHGVTPIIPDCHGGYRNSLIFYPLKAFKS